MAKRTRETGRMPPDARRDALIAAALKCLSSDGHEGASIRRISAEAGVAVGLIHHHYANKEILVARAYEHLTLTLFELVKAAVGAADSDARSQLSAFIGAMLGPRVLDPGLLRAWVVFWSGMQPGNPLSDIHDRTYDDHRRFLGDLLGRLAVSRGVSLPDDGLAAIGLLALLDGLWIEGSLDPEACHPEEAMRLAEAWVDALVQDGGCGPVVPPGRPGGADA